jgi:hypothetical protein|uniref:Uncharacterized protein n=1 Tax=Myoviridae sp. ctWb16 TaxID=2827690 RepID=A0A8S5T156_9CAUD|nr:MAG TPA: hypothetical protein [Myoviridae sp. ctWb16]
MSDLEKTINYLKNTVKRDNYVFLRRRIDKGNGKKTLGWVVKKENSDNYLENIDFDVLNKIKSQL